MIKYIILAILVTLALVGITTAFADITNATITEKHIDMAGPTYFYGYLVDSNSTIYLLGAKGAQYRVLSMLNNVTVGQHYNLTHSNYVVSNISS